jgi:hypothetical protein
VAVCAEMCEVEGVEARYDVALVGAPRSVTMLFKWVAGVTGDMLEGVCRVCGKLGNCSHGR